MSKTFRAWKIDEPLFLPATVRDFVAEDHLARFVLDLVRDDIDLAAITGTYGSERGQPPFDPTMMTALLLYSYCCGIYSSRRIAKACRERVDFMSIVALDAPDFRTISDFRKRHLKALGQLFGQILRLCEKAGLVKLGHVALDGTKIKASASKHKAMSYERMEKRAAELEAEVAKWLSAAEAADAEEDKLHGCDQTGEEMPDWVADKKRRAERIREAKAELEAEAKAAAEAKLKAAAEAAAQREAEGRSRKPGPKAAPPATEPDAKAQKNFTDPDSRIMKSKDGFVQAYNAQAAVDAEAQIIVAHDVTQSAVDCGQLVPMTDAIESNLGRKPEQLSADAGYCSETNLEALENRNIDAYVATGRARDAVAGTVKGEATAAPSPEPAGEPTRVEAMRAKIKAGGHTSPYRLRKQLPEPVFGQIKQARGFRQFLLRSIERVCAEWAIVCTVHNLLKLAQRRSLCAALPIAAAAGSGA
jgi:transposase/predicted  nucleic acid-binding Zn-ribbon protein